MILDLARRTAGVRVIEQPVVEADLGRHRVDRRYPVQRGLDLAAVRCVAATGGRIVGAAELDDVALLSALSVVR